MVCQAFCKHYILYITEIFPKKPQPLVATKPEKMNVNRPKPHAKMHCFSHMAKAKRLVFTNFFLCFFGKATCSVAVFFPQIQDSLVGRAAEIQRQGLLRLYEQVVY